MLIEMKISKTAVSSFWRVVIPGFAISILSENVRIFLSDDPLRVAVTVFLLAVLGFLSWYICSVRDDEELRNEYKLFVETNKLDPKHFGFQQREPGDHIPIGYRPYYDAYIPRKAIPYNRRNDKEIDIDSSQIYSEEQLGAILKQYSSLLLIGKPTEGKTRTLFEIVRKFPNFILISTRSERAPSDAALKLLRGRSVLWLLDDIHNSAQTPAEFLDLQRKIAEVTGGRLALAGTCRDAEGLDSIFSVTPIKVIYEFLRHKLILLHVNEEQKNELKSAIHEIDSGREYSTLGSICMREHFERMRERFEMMNELDKDCLRALVLLDAAFIYPITRRRVQKILSEVFEHGDFISDSKVRDGLINLSGKGFLISSGVADPIFPEAAYITGEEGLYYYRLGTNPDNRTPSDDISRLATCLSKNNDVEGINQLGEWLYWSGQVETALGLWGGIISQFGDSREPVVEGQVARALINKGAALGQLGEIVQSIAYLDEVEDRYGEKPQLTLQEQVAMAFFNKGVIFGQHGKPMQALACYEKVITRYQQSFDLILREKVAKALFNKGVVLGQIGEPEQAMACYDEVITRYGEAHEAILREEVARAFVNKGVTLGHLGRIKQAAAVFNTVIERYQDASEVALREQVARALVNKGIALGRIDKYTTGAMACYDQVITHYGKMPETILREVVARALIHKGIALARTGLLTQAMACFDQVETDYSGTTEAVIEEQVVKALVNKGIALAQLNHFEQARAVLTSVDRYRGAPEPAIGAWVDKASELINRIDAKPRGNEKDDQ
jgi:tetratricopeptide (TPR) repeat protein